MRTRVMNVIERMRPHTADGWTLMFVAVAFGFGVFMLAWHGRSLRFEADGAVMGWAVLVAFGMTWHGEWQQAWRVGAGLVAGALVAMGAWYGVQSALPVTALGHGIGLGIAAFGIAVVAHLMPRVFSFAGAAVGFGVGVAASRAFPVRPTTPADDLSALMLTTALTLAVGTFGSMALRASILWMGTRRPGVVRFRPHRSHPSPPDELVAETEEILAVEHAPKSQNGKRRKPTPKTTAAADAPTKRMSAAR